MKNIPTAEEWLSNHKELSAHDVASYDEGGYLGVDEKALYTIMIEFAKFNVEATKKELFNEDDVRNVLKTIKILDPVHLEMIDSGHGEFPDTFKLTEQGIAKIIEQIKQSRL